MFTCFFCGILLLVIVMKKEENVKKEKIISVNTVKKGASDFKVFISRGNVVDMAVGVIIGGAFGKIVTSLVNDVLMPFVGILLGGVDFSKLSINIGDAKILYGSFIQTIIDFLIIAFCIFIIVKLFEKFKKNDEVKEEVKKSDEIVVLEEIRDLLKKDR